MAASEASTENCWKRWAVAELRYRLVNVFAAEPVLSGNPLCVFEDASGLDTATMQALTLQFNLSETTFLLPSDRADARVRIFSPAGEMPFAGHPTLGTAAVVSSLRGGLRNVSLEMQAGVIPVAVDGDRYTLTANAPSSRPCGASPAELADMLGLAPGDIGDGACWVSTGNEQLLIPLTSVQALQRAEPVSTAAEVWANDRGMVKLYCFVEGDGPSMPVRFFFGKQKGVLAEDPGTGSACANLGGWRVLQGKPLPWSCVLHQGDHLGRACRLQLDVDAAGTIRVGGRVVELAEGVLRLGTA